MATDGEWVTFTHEGFFSSSHRDTDFLSIVYGTEVATIRQVHQSLLNADLVREALAGDADGEVARAAKVANLEKVLEAGPPAQAVQLSPGPPRSSSSTGDRSHNRHRPRRSEGKPR
jgi:hypothetical protein